MASATAVPIRNGRAIGPKDGRDGAGGADTKRGARSGGVAAGVVGRPGAGIGAPPSGTSAVGGAPPGAGAV